MCGLMAIMFNKPVSVFLTLVTLCAAGSYFLMFQSQYKMSNAGLALLALQFAPLVAAFITRLVFDRSLTGFGWRFPSLRALFVCLTLPFLISVIAFALVWGLGFGVYSPAAFIDETKAALNSLIGVAPSSDMAVLALAVIANGTLGLLVGLPGAIGEEFGWRGFLLPELIKHHSFAKSSIIVGIIWAVYHYPLLIWFFAPDMGVSAIPLLISTFFAAIGLSLVMNGIYLHARSVWTAVIFHAALNLHLQGFFEQITNVTTPLGQYMSGQHGFMVALVACVFGYFTYQRHAKT